MKFHEAQDCHHCNEDFNNKLIFIMFLKISGSIEEAKQNLTKEIFESDFQNFKQVKT